MNSPHCAEPKRNPSNSRTAELATIFDASVLLALVLDEPGAERATESLSDGIISSVNLAEVMSILTHRGASREDLDALLNDLPLEIEDFTTDDAIQTALLRPQTRSHGLSLGDRACLALGHRLQGRVLTADKAWADLSDDLSLSIELLR